MLGIRDLVEGQCSYQSSVWCTQDDDVNFEALFAAGCPQPKQQQQQPQDASADAHSSDVIQISTESASEAESLDTPPSLVSSRSTDDDDSERLGAASEIGPT
jgi:hypothetical protein